MKADEQVPNRTVTLARLRKPVIRKMTEHHFDYDGNNL